MECYTGLLTAHLELIRTNLRCTPFVRNYLSWKWIKINISRTKIRQHTSISLASISAWREYVSKSWVHFTFSEKTFFEEPTGPFHFHERRKWHFMYRACQTCWNRTFFLTNIFTRKPYGKLSRWSRINKYSSVASKIAKPHSVSGLKLVKDGFRVT